MTDHFTRRADSSRREFFRSLGRGAVLGLLGGGAGFLGRRRRADGESVAACPGREICARCGLQRSCSLPLAVAYRKETTP